MSIHAFTSTIVEIRPAVFLPTNHTFQELYGKAEPNYQIEVAKKLPDRFRTIWFWSNIDQLYQTGKLGNHCGSSTISVTNVSLGLKSIGSLSSWSQIYLGIGPCFLRVHMDLDSPCFDEKHLSRFSIGGAFKSGLYFTIKRKFILDLFCDYFYQPVNLQNCRNIGGLKIGLGFGYKFGQI